MNVRDQFRRPIIHEIKGDEQNADHQVSPAPSWYFPMDQISSVFSFSQLEK